MKSLRVRILRILVAAVLISLCASTFAVAEPLLFDYADVVLTVGENSLVLDLTQTPVLRLVAENEALALYIQTTSGETRMVVTPGDVELTEAAAAFLEEAGVNMADLMDEALAADAAPLCAACGASTATGTHTRLACGHYACVVGDDHPTLCAYCKRYTCNELDHNAVCAVCGNHVCTRAHRDACAAKSGDGAKPDNGVIISPDGRSFSLSPRERTFYDGGEERMKLLHEFENVCVRIEELENKKERTDAEQAELAALRIRQTELAALLY